MTAPTSEVFVCRCGDLVNGIYCPHCDRPCDKKICLKCRKILDNGKKK